RFLKKNTANYSDAELITRYQKNGDMDVLGVLYDRYLELIYGVCLKILKNEAEAEDAALSIFEKLSVKVRQHDIQQFRPWLNTLVRNHCLEILRKQKRHLTVSYDGEFMQSQEMVHPFMEDVLGEQKTALQRCLLQLTGEQKACVQLFYFEGYTYKEIAQQKEVAVGKIRSYIQNGRRNLRICMEEGL
ncbi:MAG: RNA polymerase sigma factor, partial [Bacteroidota bacterium]